MIISTFNIQNNVRNYNKNKSKEIYNYIKKNKIDIIGLQEVFNKCNDDLGLMIGSKYNIVGKFRYFFNIFFPLKNERNPIISKYEILNNRTYHLPSHKAKYKRIITKAIIKYKGKLISVYNTHIEVSNNEVKERQLNKIYNIIRRDKNDVILMGDFNLKKTDSIFKEFIKKLKGININHVDLNDDTFKSHKDREEIDHIFVSNNFDINKKIVFKDLSISDHYPVIIDVNLKD